MIFCEDCRVKKKWPRAAGFPYIGIKQNGTCEICKKHDDCHDIPASKLISDAEKSSTERAIDKLMQQGHREKAEVLIVVYPSGKIDYTRTGLLQELEVRKNDEIDWYETYQLRLAAKHEIENSNRRKHG